MKAKGVLQKSSAGRPRYCIDGVTTIDLGDDFIRPRFEQRNPVPKSFLPMAPRHTDMWTRDVVDVAQIKKHPHSLIIVNIEMEGCGALLSALRAFVRRQRKRPNNTGRHMNRFGIEVFSGHGKD